MKCAIMVFVALAMLAAVATATAPGIITYQGRLLGPTGSVLPDSNYFVWFRFYNAYEGGTVRFWEGHRIYTKGGLFTVRLGEMGGLDGTTFPDTVTYLGIQIDGESEMTPRTRMTSAAFALQSQTVEGRSNGRIRTSLRPVSQASGWLMLSDSLGGGQAGLIQQSTGNTLMLLRPGTGLTGLQALVSEDEATLSLYKSDGSRKVYVNADGAGDTATVLPAASVSANEMYNEAGITCNDWGSTVTITSTVMDDIVVLSVSAPSTGYVCVIGKGTAYLSGTTGRNYIYAQIDDSIGGNAEVPYCTVAGAESFASTQPVYVPFAVTRVFPVTAGSHVFRLEARGATSPGAGANTEVRHAMMQGLFFPTAYGSIATILPASEAGEFENAEPVKVDGESMYRVDLRELELRAAKAEAAAERANAEAGRAKLQLLEEKLRRVGE